MLTFKFFRRNQEPLILCLGAHPDDIEIGCGGTLLRLTEEMPKASFYWVVFSGDGKRQKEANDSAKAFLETPKVSKIIVKQFKDSYFPFIGDQIKGFFEELKRDISPDMIFTHYGNDAHQDHRLISSLTWNTFRDNFVLEYEIPKFDGDLVTPNLYVPLSDVLVKKKTNLILENFSSQQEKPWFTEDSFMSFLRIRGIECNSQSKYAEAFHCRKIVF
jgi:LmbE family N-acetylglucosaminyl deacetylase